MSDATLRLVATYTPRFSKCCEPYAYFSLFMHDRPNVPVEFHVSFDTPSSSVRVELPCSVPLPHDTPSSSSPPSTKHTLTREALALHLHDCVTHVLLFAHVSTDPARSPTTIGQKQVDRCALLWQRLFHAYAAAAKSHRNVPSTLRLHSTHGKFTFDISLSLSTYSGVPLSTLLPLVPRAHTHAAQQALESHCLAAQEHYFCVSRDISAARYFGEHTLPGKYSKQPCLWLTRTARANHMIARPAAEGYSVSCEAAALVAHRRMRANPHPPELFAMMHALAARQFPGSGVREALERLAFVVRFLSCTSVYLSDEVDTCARQHECTGGGSGGQWKKHCGCCGDTTSTDDDSSETAASGHSTQRRRNTPSHQVNVPSQGFTLLSSASIPRTVSHSREQARVLTPLIPLPKAPLSEVLDALKKSRVFHAESLRLHASKDDDRMDCPSRASDVGLSGEDCDSVSLLCQHVSFSLQQLLLEHKKKRARPSCWSEACQADLALAGAYDFLAVVCRGSLSPRSRHVSGDESDHEEEADLLCVHELEPRVEKVMDWATRGPRRWEEQLCSHEITAAVPVSVENLWVERGLELGRLLQRGTRDEVHAFCERYVKEDVGAASVDEKSTSTVAAGAADLVRNSILLLECTRFAYCRQGHMDPPPALETAEYKRVRTLLNEFQCRRLIACYTLRKDTLCRDGKRCWNRYQDAMHIRSMRLLDMYGEGHWYLVDLKRRLRRGDKRFYPRLSVNMEHWLDPSQVDRFVLLPAHTGLCLMRGEERAKWAEAQVRMLEYMGRWTPAPRVHEVYATRGNRTDEWDAWEKSEREAGKKEWVTVYYREADWALVQREWTEWCRTFELDFDCYRIQLFAKQSPYYVVRVGKKKNASKEKPGGNG